MSTFSYYTVQLRYASGAKIEIDVAAAGPRDAIRRAYETLEDEPDRALIVSASAEPFARPTGSRFAWQSDDEVQVTGPRSPSSPSRT